MKSKYQPTVENDFPKAKIKNFPMLKPPELKVWVTNRIIEDGSKISLPALNLLIRLIGSNLWVMSSELNKLATYAYGRQIEERDVKALVSYTQQSTVFNLVDAIMEFKANESESLLQQLMDKGATATYLLAMVYRQMRLIVRARDLKRQGVRDRICANGWGSPLIMWSRRRWNRQPVTPCRGSSRSINNYWTQTSPSRPESTPKNWR